MSLEILKVDELEKRLFSIKNDRQFEQLAVTIFLFQYANNRLYRAYSDLIGVTPDSVTDIRSIPFLPISFFKTHQVQTTSFQPELIFESSGTTGATNSKHYIHTTLIYQKSYREAFKLFYGEPSEYCILALLPSYLERGNSSLVHMVQGLMYASGHPLNDFYLHDHKKLADTLRQVEEQQQKTLLIGVTYALLDFAAAYPQQLAYTFIMETGGMKGRREELIRTEVHRQLKHAFSVDVIHSEYGMTELLSQAYAKAEGKFSTPPWMKVLLREEDDLKNIIVTVPKAMSGALNIIDLANLYSCSFIATEDAGKLYPDGSFDVLGRMDNTDIRGCSLLAI